MKKIVIIIIFVFISGHLFAQEIGIDGFVLGNSRSTTENNASKKDFKFNKAHDNWVEYVTNPHLIHYTLYFGSGNLIKISKLEENYNPSLFENHIKESYFNIVLEYGEPTISSDSYYIWRIGKNKITFKYSSTSEQVRTLQGIETWYTLTITTTIE